MPHALPLLLLLLLTAGTRSLAFAPTPAAPRINFNPLPLTTQYPQPHKLISLDLPSINYQISSHWYSAPSAAITDQNIFNKSAYRDSDDGDRFCYLFGTTIRTRRLGVLGLGDGVEVDNWGVGKGRLWVYGDDGAVSEFGVNGTGVELRARTDVKGELEGKEVVEILQIGERLFVFTNRMVYLFTPDSTPALTPVQGLPQATVITDVGIITDRGLNNTRLWLISSSSLYIYQLTAPTTLNMSLFIDHPTITGPILATHFDPKSQNLFITAASSLHIITLGDPQQPRTTYQLLGTCTSITMIKSALYLVCQYQRNTYIGQYQISNNNVSNISVNRYYNDDLVQGIRQVRSLGYDRMAIVGDEQAVILGEAVNRQILLQLQSRNEKQLSQTVYSFGMIDFVYLPEYSSMQVSTILVIGLNEIKLQTITFQPPQLQCILDRQQLGTSLNLLLAFNTTHCPYAVNDPNTAGGNTVICQTLIPYQFVLGAKQFEEKTARLVLFLVLLISSVLALVCGAWGVKIRRQANAVLAAVRGKIERVRRQGSQVEMKKI